MKNAKSLAEYIPASWQDTCSLLGDGMWSEDVNNKNKESLGET